MHRRENMDDVAVAENLTPEELALKTPKGTSIYRSRVHWAQAFLAQAGAVNRPQRGYLEITERGMQWGIVTNKPALYTDALVPKIGLKHAACVISGDTTPHAKPHPEPLFEAARQLQLAPQECWYVGDDLRDIQAGQAAGMPTIAAAWGYCGHTEPADWLADIIAAHPLDLVTLITRS